MPWGRISRVQTGNNRSCNLIPMNRPGIYRPEITVRPGSPARSGMWRISPAHNNRPSIEFLDDQTTYGTRTPHPLSLTALEYPHTPVGCFALIRVAFHQGLR